MDPKSLANLDPKLRETYERVMGTTTSQADADSQSPFVTTAQPAPADAAPATDTTTPAGDTTTPVSAPTDNTGPSQIPTDSAFSTPPTETPAAPAPVEEPTPAPNPSPYMSVGEAPAQNANPYASAAPFPSPAEVAQSKEVSPVLRVLYIVGASIFFIAYTFFWMRIFNLQLPSF